MKQNWGLEWGGGAAYLLKSPYVQDNIVKLKTYGQLNIWGNSVESSILANSYLISSLIF